MVEIPIGMHAGNCSVDFDACGRIVGVNCAGPFEMKRRGFFASVAALLLFPSARLIPRGKRHRIEAGWVLGGND